MNVYPLTDAGVAERFADRYHRTLKYDHTAGKWYVWEGKVWTPDETGQVRTKCLSVIRSLYSEAQGLPDAQRQSLTKFALRCETAHAIDSILRLAQCDSRIAVTHDYWDRDPGALNVFNGVVTFGESVSFKEHDADFCLTKIADMHVDEAQDCPAWSKFLKEIFDGNLDMCLYVQRAVGYTLSASQAEQVLFFCYGTGANGKTVFAETLRTLFGGYGMRAPMDMLLARGNEGITNDVAGLQGARLVICSEIPEGRRLNESKVKDLSGNDTIRARFLYQESFEFRPTHTLWLIGNHKPRVRGTDDGIWRRLHLIPFNVVIPPERRRPMSELLDEFRMERAGVLNWMLEGYREYRKHGLAPPRSVTDATREYREGEDQIKPFVEECLVIGDGALTPHKDLMTAYREWCGENGEVQMSSSRMIARMQERGHVLVIGPRKARLWQGIGLTAEIPTPRGERNGNEWNE